MTVAEIKEGLFDCNVKNGVPCVNCPYTKIRDCQDVMTAEALAYIGHLEGALQDFIGRWLDLEESFCDCCVHHDECNDPKMDVEGAPLPPKEKCIEGIIARVRQEFSGEEG